MNNNLKFLIKLGTDLTLQELDAINQAKNREWNITPMSQEHKEDRMFALLKNEKDEILAQGELIPIDGVMFDNERFSIIGIGGIIASQKGSGFGRRLMEGVMEYLKKVNKTGLGFAGDNVIGFYQKCGFQSDHSSLKRFVHLDGGARITNTTEDCVFYFDSEDNFMKKILSNPGIDILLPRDPDW